MTTPDPLPLTAHGEYYLAEAITTDRAVRLAQALLAEAEGAQAFATKPTITLNLCSPGGIVDGLFLRLCCKNSGPTQPGRIGAHGGYTL